MEDRPRFQTGPREIRPSGIIGGPRETWPGWNCAPTSHTEWARMVNLHLYTGAPELYPNKNMLPHKSPVNSSVAAAPTETITTNTTALAQFYFSVGCCCLPSSE